MYLAYLFVCFIYLFSKSEVHEGLKEPVFLFVLFFWSHDKLVISMFNRIHFDNNNTYKPI